MSLALKLIQTLGSKTSKFEQKFDCNDDGTRCSCNPFFFNYISLP